MSFLGRIYLYFYIFFIFLTSILKLDILFYFALYFFSTYFPSKEKLEKILRNICTSPLSYHAAPPL